MKYKSRASKVATFSSAFVPQGWWDFEGVRPVAVYQASGAASYADSLVNLVQPGTYDLVEAPTYGGPVSWDANDGWLFGTQADYGALLAAGVRPTNENWSVAVSYFSSRLRKDSAVWSFGAAEHELMPSRSINDQCVAKWGSVFWTPSPSLPCGTTIRAGRDLYSEGVYHGTTPDGWADPVNDLAIGARSSSAAKPFRGEIYAFAIYDGVLAAEQVLALHNAMESLRTKRWFEVPGVEVAYDAMGVAAIEDSFVNLAAPGLNDITTSVSPTLNANGMVFNGSSQYAETGIIPKTSATIAVRTMTTPSNNAKYVTGTVAAGAGVAIVPRTPANIAIFYAPDQLNTDVLNIVDGTVGVSGQDVYGMAAYQGTATGTMPTHTYSLPIGCRNVDGAYGGWWNGVVAQYFEGDRVLTQAQMTSLLNAMQARVGAAVRPGTLE